MCTVDHLIGLTSKRLEQKVMHIRDSLKVASVSFLLIVASTTSHMIKLLYMAQARRTYQVISKLTNEQYIADIDNANRNEFISVISKYRKSLTPFKSCNQLSKSSSPNYSHTKHSSESKTRSSQITTPQTASPATKRNMSQPFRR